MSDTELKSNEEWRAWGEEDPMFGVAAWAGRGKDDANPWTTEDFYALGVSDWGAFYKVWRSNFDVQTGAALEIGAGAGRMTAQLAKTFQSVKALDVSDAMLAFAADNVKAPNVEWLLSDGLRFPAADGSIDAIFSCHVFQHFDNHDAVAANFRECARVLKPGGSLCIHLPVHAFPDVNRSFSNLCRKMYNSFLKLQRVKAERRRKAMRKGRAKPYMHGISSERGLLLDLIKEIGLTDPLIVTVVPPESPGQHTLILAVKPGSQTGLS